MFEFVGLEKIDWTREHFLEGTVSLSVTLGTHSTWFQKIYRKKIWCFMDELNGKPKK